MDFIDLHTHGIAGLDTRSTDPDDYLRMAKAYLAHGTAAFLPTLFPAPIKTMRAQLFAIRKAMDAQGGGGEAGAGAKILGAHLEGPFVNPARCGALDGESFLAPDAGSLKRLVDGFEEMVRIITVAPELPGALKLIETAAEEGIKVNMGHSAATSAQAADGRRAGASGVTHIFNAAAPFHHREPGLAGYALCDDELYVEVIADLAHLHPDTLRVILRCKPVDRILLISDSLGPAKTAAAPEKGPLYMADKETLAGSGITLRDAVANTVSLGIGEDVARRFASANPAAYIRRG